MGSRVLYSRALWWNGMGCNDSVERGRLETQVKEDLKVDAQVARVLAKCRPWYPTVDLTKRATALREVFGQLDCDREGTLDIRELRPFLTYFLRSYLELEIQPEHIEVMFYALDVDNSADINFAEFLWFMLSCKVAGRPSCRLFDVMRHDTLTHK